MRKWRFQEGNQQQSGFSSREPSALGQRFSAYCGVRGAGEACANIILKCTFTIFKAVTQNTLKVLAVQSRLTLYKACHSRLSMELSRLEYWSGYPFPSPEDLPDPETEPRSPAWQADSLPSEPAGSPTQKSAHPVIPGTKQQHPEAFKCSGVHVSVNSPGCRPTKDSSATSVFIIEHLESGLTDYND